MAAGAKSTENTKARAGPPATEEGGAATDQYPGDASRPRLTASDQACTLVRET